MEKQKLILIGNGMSGVRCIENILKEDSDVFDITIFGTEAYVNYSRIMLSSVLQGGTNFHDIFTHPESWYEENDIKLYTNETVLEINQVKKRIKTDKQKEMKYDKLILATGSSPISLPIPGAEKKGVMTFRTIEDCQYMIKTAENYQKAVVIGGGLLGLEAAKGLLHLGMKVNVVHRSSYLMEKQLDHVASNMLKKELESQGINFLLEKDTEEIIGGNHVEAIRFKVGLTVPADLVVMAVGVRPNIELAMKTGLQTNRGIVVNDWMATSCPEIYAVGECVEHEGKNYGLVKPLYEQGEVLAKHLCKQETARYQGTVLSTQLKVSGMDIFSVGEFTADDYSHAIQIQNEVDSVYKKIVFRGNKVVGAVLFGDTRQGSMLLDLIKKKKVVADPDKFSLLDTPNIMDSYVATMPMNEQVCTCNSVSKEGIIDAVQTKNLTTVQEVKQCTKASSSCGGCWNTVNELLTYIQSESFNETTVNQSICTCTTLNEDEIVSYIQVKQLRSIDEVMSELPWKRKKGCSICRAALKYHLEIIYPDYEETTNQIKAIQQSDGTYKIIPQLYGGQMDSSKLRRILNTIESYPMLKLAVGTDQKIHILGIREEDLTDIRMKLNIPIYVPVENQVEITQSSVDGGRCPCVIDSIILLSVKLEKKMEFLKVPHTIKIGIYCKHKQLGSSFKEIAVIQVDNSWEIHVGGSIQRPNSSELLCVVFEEKDVEDMVYSFIQYYRESANYLENIQDWVNRIGLVQIREALFDTEIRRYFLNMMNDSILQRKHQLIKI